MICIKRVFKTADKAAKFRQTYQEALAGSPAFNNSEIFIQDGDHPNEFLLVIGMPNTGDMMETWVEPGAFSGEAAFREHITSRFEKCM